MKSILAILLSFFMFNVLAEDIDSGAAGGSANVLKIDSNDFEQRDFILDGGTFLVGPGAAEYVKEGVSVTVSAGSAVSLDTIKKPAFSPNAFVFKYNAKSGDWASRENYSSELFVDSIEEFVSLNNPLAPNGTSLSQKDVYVGGWFYVTDREAGEWVFWGIYDDNMRFLIDGEEVFNTPNWQTSQQKTVSLAAGWHKFEIRCYDNTGDWGKSGGILKAKSLAMSELRLFHEKNFIMKKVAVPVDLTIKDSAKVSVASDEYEFGSIEFEEGAELSFLTNCSLSASKGISGFGSVAVAENCSLDLRNANFSENMELTLKGSGTTVLGGNLPSVLKAEDGQIVLLPYVAYDTSKVQIGENVKVKVALGSVFYDAEAVAVDGGLKKYVPLSDEFVPYSANASWTSGNTLVLCGEDVVFDIDAADFPMPKKIIAQSGAMLKVTASVALPEIELADDAGLIIAAKGVAMHNGFAAQGDINRLPFFAIAAGAELSVPGGMKFSGVDMLINGTLSAAGDLTLGYVASGESGVFDLTVDGGAIRANSGVLKFLCPDGTITVPDNTITFKSAVFESGVSGVDLKPQFCDTLPVEQSILFDCDNTWIDFATGNYVLRGSTRFHFTNGGGITKSNASPHNSAALWIADKVKISMSGGASFFYGESLVAGSSGGSALGFQPTEESEVFSIEGGEIGWHRTDMADREALGRKIGGNGKAKIRVDGTVFKTVHASWSRGSILGGFKEVVLGEGGIFIVNDANVGSINIASPFTGNGSVRILNNKNDTFKVILDANCEHKVYGSISAGERCSLVFPSGVNWLGTVVYNDNVQFDGMPETSHGEITVGALELQKPLVYRIWENGNDKINFTGKGIIPNGHEVQILLKDGYDPTPGTTFDLGMVTSSFDWSGLICTSDRWTFSLVDVAGDEGHQILRMTVNAVAYVFKGGENGEISDISDVRAWTSMGETLDEIPVGQDVVIEGSAVALGEIPKFGSITVKDGAKLVLRKKEGENASQEIVLPPMELQDAAEFVVEGGVSARMDGAFATVVKDGDVCPSVKILADGALLLLGGSKLGGMSLEVAGLLATTGVGDLTLGYASSGRRWPFFVAVDGGVISNEFGNIDFACPAAGGEVYAFGGKSWEIRNATLLPEAYKGGFNFGVNNSANHPITVNVVGTLLEYFRLDKNFSSAPVFGVDGAVRVVFGEGSRMYKHYRANDGQHQHSIFTIGNRGQLVFENGSKLEWHAGSNGDSVGAGQFNMYPSEEGFESLVVSGATFFYHRMGSNKKAVLHLDDAAYICERTSWNFRMPFVAHDSPLKHVFLEGNNKYMRKGGASYHSCSSEVPFVGTGNLTMVDYENKSIFFAIKSSANKATGKIAAEGGCRLYFLGDSNWNGVVVANGKVELASSESNGSATHDSPVTVAFAKLDLQADFPVKVWKGEDGKITGNDTLNVSEYINNGGRLVPELAGEGEFVLGDKIVVGEIGDSSPLPRVAKGWTASRKTIDAKSMLMLSKGVGFMMIVR